MRGSYFVAAMCASPDGAGFAGLYPHRVHSAIDLRSHPLTQQQACRDVRLRWSRRDYYA